MNENDQYQEHDEF